jgi:hypothetical protein
LSKLVLVVFVVLVVLAPYLAQARWAPPVPWQVRRTVGPADQSWRDDVPESPGARAKRKLAVFPFLGDDVNEPIRAAVVKSLRRRGLNVTTKLRPVDSAQQFREMSVALSMVAFVEGEVMGDGPRQRARILLRSGATGQPIASTTFSGPTNKIVAEVNRTLWSRFGPVVSRSSAARARQRERAPLLIDAGTPLDPGPLAGGR